MDWSQILYTLCYVCVALLAAIITKYVIPILQQKINSAGYSELLETITAAVKCAEQTMQKSTGTDKKEYVVNLVQTVLASKSVSWTDEQINALIEAAVYEVKQNEL